MQSTLVEMNCQIWPCKLHTQEDQSKLRCSSACSILLFPWIALSVISSSPTACLFEVVLLHNFLHLPQLMPRQTDLRTKTVSEHSRLVPWLSKPCRCNRGATDSWSCAVASWRPPSRGQPALATNQRSRHTGQTSPAASTTAPQSANYERKRHEGSDSSRLAPPFESTCSLQAAQSSCDRTPCCAR